MNESGNEAGSVTVGLPDGGPCKNTDREIWRGPDEGNGSYYADSLFITEYGALGINCGGTVRVRSIRGWHKLAEGPLVYDKANRTIKTATPNPPSLVEELRKIAAAGDIPPKGHAGLAERAATEIDRLNEEVESLNNIISGYVDAIGRSE